MSADPVLVSRIQFAFTVGFHILWPAYTIGISGFIVILNILWLRTRRQVYRDLLRFWIHLFALGFAMGVVTGVVISYEIGTNWSVFAERTANVIGPFFTYKVLTAFFLEAGFVGIMLFGMDRVGPPLHLAACCLVAAGAVISAFWILTANSWMQTPAGFTITPDGKFDVTNWSAAIFTPSMPYRFAHMVTAAYISGTFVVIGISGWYLWHRQHVEFASAAFSVAMWIALVLTPLQLVLGDLHGRNSFHYQPIKVAAMEGDWDTRRGASLKLFAKPDMATERNDWAIEIPKLGSLILTHSWNGLVSGLKAAPPDDRPYVPVVFWAFRLMVGIGLMLIGISVVAAWLRWRGRLYDTRWFNMICAFSSPLPFIAVLSGWTVTEVGRQPFVVYGQLRTADAVSPVAVHAVTASLILFVIVYTVLLIAFFAYATRIVLRGPRRETEPSPAEVRPGINSAVAQSPAE